MWIGLKPPVADDLNDIRSGGQNEVFHAENAKIEVIPRPGSYLIYPKCDIFEMLVEMPAPILRGTAS